MDRSDESLDEKRFARWLERLEKSIKVGSSQNLATRFWEFTSVAVRLFFEKSGLKNREIAPFLIFRGFDCSKTHISNLFPTSTLHLYFASRTLVLLETATLQVYRP